MTFDVSALDPRVNRDLADHLLALQLRSYAVEAALIGDDRIPPLHETVDDIAASKLTWLGARDSDRAVIAAIGYDATTELIDIDRLVVDPLHLRRGAGRMLVTAVQELAHGRPVIVATGRANQPARSLYERLGFMRTGDHEALPGLWIARYRWP